MNFLSAKEISEKWKLSQSQVRRLAEKGKIKGAKLVGSYWIFPENTKKPIDGRTKESKKVLTKYRFPLFVFGKYTEEEIESFTEDEKILFEAQRSYCNCEFEKAKKILEELIKKTSSLYVKIGCLYYLCFAYQHTREFSKVEDSLFSMRLIFESDFDYKKELLFILYDLILMFDNPSKVFNCVTLDFSTPYSREAETFILTEEACVEVMKIISGKTDINTRVFELLCERFTSEGYYVCAMYLHYYIETIYELERQTDKARFHASKAIEKANKTRCYAPLFGLSFSNFDVFESLLKDLPDEDRIRALKMHKKFKDDISDYFNHTQKTSFYTKLSDEDFKFASYVVKNFPNKEIAKLEQIAESTVNKKLMVIYEKLGISGKKELCELAISSIVDKKG